MRSYLLLVVPVLLSGCAAPPALVIASYGADGLSYLASGKSLEDHGLSYALDEDCALHRVILEQPICSDFKPADVQAEASAAGAGAPVPGKAGKVGSTPVVVGAGPGEPAAPPSGRPEAAALPPPAATVAPQRYLVLGSFRERANARRFADRLGQPKLAVVPARLPGRIVYRVVAGPVTETGMTRLRADLAGRVPAPPWEVAALPPATE